MWFCVHTEYLFSSHKAKAVCLCVCICVFICVIGRAEAIRLMLKDQGKEWKEIPVTMETWMEGTVKDSCVSY